MVATGCCSWDSHDQMMQQLARLWILCSPLLLPYPLPKPPPLPCRVSSGYGVPGVSPLSAGLFVVAAGS